jgi:acetyl-CoA acyltransferase
VRSAVIIDAVRTPVGRRDGALSGMHAVDLAAAPIKSLLDRTGVDPMSIDDVVLGCVTQTGEQGINVARNAVLAAGLPEEVPAVSVDRQCGSSQQAAHFVAQAVMAGQYDVAIAAGVESMSRVPMGATAKGPGTPFGPTMADRYAHQLVPQGLSAEMIADKWNLSRERLDAIAFESHQRAMRATEEGRFDSQLVPIEGLARDEGIRPNTSLEKLASLKPVFKADGRVTAGNSSQISDGAAALLIMGEDTAEELGMTPLARFHAFSLAGVDPVMMLTGPIPATEKVLERSGLGLEEIDLFEVNEAFASVVGAWLDETGADWKKTNVNGGAIALGHPLGASGAKLMTTLVHEMQRTGARYGLQTMCEGGGMANGTILERI